MSCDAEFSQSGVLPFFGFVDGAAGALASTTQGALTRQLDRSDGCALLSEVQTTAIMSRKRT